VEKRHVGFGDAPVVGGGQNIAGQIEFAQESTSAGGLVAGDADEVAGVFECLQAGPDVGVEVEAVEIFAQTSVETGCRWASRSKPGRKYWNTWR
jgi:hypothetical protein